MKTIRKSQREIKSLLRFKSPRIRPIHLLLSSETAILRVRVSFRKLKHLEFNQIKIAIIFLPIALYLFSPSTKAGFASLTDWGDQSTYLSAYEEWKNSGKSGWLDNNWIGPGFIALIRVLSLPFSSTQVALIMASFLGLLAGLLILFKQKAILERNMIPVIFLVSFVFLTHLQVFKDIPWTHFWVLPMLLSAIIAMYGGESGKTKTFLGGFLLVFAWQIRNFETLAVIIAIMISALLSLFVEVRHKKFRFVSDLNRRLILLSGAITGFVLIGLLSGHYHVYRQYRPSGVFSQMPPALDLNPINGINRLIQLFFNPTFGSLTGYSTSPEIGFTDQIIVRGSDLSAFWGQSLMRQQPMLVPLALVSLAITLSYLLRFIQGLKNTRQFKVVFCLGLSGWIVICGYLAQPIIGTGHLKYGIVREFLLPQFLFALQILLVFATNRRLYSGSLVIVLLASLTLPWGLNFANASYKDYRFSVNENCIGNRLCSTEIQVLTQKGEIRTLPSEAIYIRESCGDKTVFYYGRSNGFPLGDCSEDHHISVLPTSFGFASTPEGQTILELKKSRLLK